MARVASDFPDVLELVLTTCAECLQQPRDSLHPEDSFLGLGGSSVHAFMINSALEQKLAEVLPPEGLPITAIVQRACLRDFADEIAQLIRDGTPASHDDVEEGVL